MASVSISPIGNGYQFFTAGGLIVPLSGGLLYTYAAGTSTPTATYTDSAGSVLNTNPIVLSSDGRTPSEIWLIDGTAYKFVLKNSAGSTIATYDNISGGLNSTSAQVASVPQYVATVGGSGNAISLSPTIAPSSYTSGLTFTFKAIATNTGATTVNVSGVGAVSVRTKEGIALTGGEIQSGGLYLIEYNSSTTSFYMLTSDSAVAPIAFTPGLAFGGSSVGITYTFRAGAYTKVGNLIFFTLDVSLSSKGAAAGVATITGLPFTQSTGFPAGSAPVVSIIVRNVTFTGYAAAFFAGLTSIGIYQVSSPAGFAPLDNTTFANNSEVLITGFYISA